MTDRIDRRRSPRIPCAISMAYGIKGSGSREGWITNIGTAGALLTTQGAIPIGVELVVNFRLPLSNRPIRIVSTARWVDDTKVGVEFAHLTIQEQDEIWRFYARELARQRESRA